jgi:CBS domain-containing protein
MTSYVLARRWRPMPIYDALLRQDGIVLPHAVPHAVDQLRVLDAMTQQVVKVHAEGTAQDALDALGARTFHSLPVVDASGAVMGLAHSADVRAAASSDLLASLTQPGYVIEHDAPLARAVVRMNELGVRQLLVVQDETLVGVLAMSDVIRAHAKVSLEAGGSQRPVGVAGGGHGASIRPLARDRKEDPG